MIIYNANGKLIIIQKNSFSNDKLYYENIMSHKFIHNTLSCSTKYNVIDKLMLLI